MSRGDRFLHISWNSPSAPIYHKIFRKLWTLYLPYFTLILSCRGGTMSLWNCGLLTGLLSIAWTTDAWIWNIGGMTTKRRNWTPEKNLSQCYSVHNVYPERTALRLNLGLISNNMVSNHLIYGSLIKSITYSILQIFPSFVMPFPPSFPLQPN
jgi:hypothetical protein